MGTTVDDVHHRHRHGRVVAQVPEQRHASRLRHRAGRGQRHREQRVGAESPLVVGAVELDHAPIQRTLVLEFRPDEGVAQRAIDVGDGFRDALAQIARLVAVAQFDRFS